ncbi:hypothetical protein ACJJIK_10075 [Microbulbifer sp. ZKSA006]|uniref:hypothetical protein n=1 Tax=Microbulbifer sp. ZKSA006 TaxID=3243390 RepID=UPI00403A7124
MAKEKAFIPEDVLPDSEDFAVIDGIQVRKGSIFAALKNIDMLEKGTNKQQELALEQLEKLAPALIALGLHKHFQCRNKTVETLLLQAGQNLEGAKGRSD